MFPQFNIYSTSLLVLIIQGLIFALMLSLKYRKSKKTADLLIVLLLLITVYHRSTYVIGFMGWYDAFKNTKVNYYLIALSLATGPLIYLYIRTTLVANFKWRKSDWLHFIPVTLFVLYKLIIWQHDASLPEWDEGYDGEWHREIHLRYVAIPLSISEIIWQSLYLAFSVQLIWQYSQKIKMYFSNLYRVELNWLKLFLAVYIFLFVFGSALMGIDAFIIDLDYVHMWWIHLLSAIAVVLLGMKAYYTDLSKLHELTYDIQVDQVRPKVVGSNAYIKEVELIKKVLEIDQVYLNPDLNLDDLAHLVQMTKHEVSQVINAGFNLNFNELINSYRVEETQKRILDPSYQHFSLVALAHDCGFNSKATFNRVFKKITGQSPTEFKRSHSH